MAGVRVEIRTHAILEVDRFANVDDGLIFVAIQITARFGRQGRENPLKFFRNFH